MTSYGPGRLNGFVFEEQVNNTTLCYAVRGYRAGAFINNGSMELGGGCRGRHNDGKNTNRTSYGLGAVVMVDEGLTSLLILNRPMLQSVQPKPLPRLALVVKCSLAMRWLGVPDAA